MKYIIEYLLQESARTECGYQLLKGWHGLGRGQVGREVALDCENAIRPVHTEQAAWKNIDEYRTLNPFIKSVRIRPATYTWIKYE